MSEIRDLELAKATFETLCGKLDKDGWHYEKDEEKLKISCGVRGDDLPMDINIEVDSKRMIVSLLSLLPFVIQEDKRLDAAIAVSAINNTLVDGCFDFDITDGHIFFRMTNSFLESKIGEAVFEYMLIGACHIIDKYNDKFLMLGKGIVSIEQFLASLND